MHTISGVSIMLSFPYATHRIAIRQNMDRNRAQPVMTPTRDKNAAIVAYWNRRGALELDEWLDFYGLVVPLLTRTRLPEEYNDERRRRDLIELFFQDKILVNAATSTAGPLQSAYALHRYLKNYEIDLRRTETPPVPLVPLHQPVAPGSTTLVADTLVAEPDEAHVRLLQEAGIDVEKALRSAHDFLDELQDGEVALLRGNTCADHEEAESAKTIAGRWAMGSSYHYKAGKLGITREKGATYSSYGSTKIGGWLRSVGAQLSGDWHAEIATLLIVLCLQVGMHPKGRLP